MLPRLPAYWLILPILLAGTHSAHAQSDKPPSLVYAFSVFAPFKVQDKNGLPKGPYTQLLQTLAQRSDIHLQTVQCPLQRCLSMLKHGQADISIGIRGNAERDRYLTFIDPPFTKATPTVFLQRHDDPRMIREYNDLHSLRVGVVEGASYFTRFDADRQIQRDATSNGSQALKKLAAHRFDVLIINARQAQALAAEINTPYFRRAPLQIAGEQPPRIAIATGSTKAQALKPRLSSELQKMLQDGTVQRILATIPQ